MNIPPGLAESLGVAIAASSVVEIGTLTLSEASTAVRDQFSDGTTQGVGTTFEETLRSRIAAVDQQRDSRELGDVLDDWEMVAAQLDTEVLPALDTAVATEQIADAIADTQGFDLSNTPGLRPKLEEAVEEAYADAVDEFRREIEQADVEYQLLQNDQQLLRELERLAREVRPTKGYRVHDTDPETLDRLAREIVAMGGGDPDIEFADPDVDVPDSTEILLVGPGGVGKTRLLSELLKRRGRLEGIEHVVVPKRSEKGYSLTEDHLKSLDREPFEGDVLLVWDDVASSGPDESSEIASNESEIFRKAVSTLDTKLGEDGNQLHVLGSSRSGPLDLDAIKRERGGGFWSRFDPVALDWEKPGTTGELVDHMLDEYGVTLGGEGDDEAAVMKTFVEKTLTAATPGYAEAVLTVAGEQLTMADVEDLPESQIELWREQFENLGYESDEYGTLRVLKHLSELNLPPFKRLVGAVAEAVFDLDNSDDALSKLTNKRFVRQVDPEESEATFVHLHDVRVEAVEVEESKTDRRRASVSEFLLNEFDPRFQLPRDFDAPERLHNAIGIALADKFDERYNDLAQQHFERAIDDNDGPYAKARYNYALLLTNELDRAEDAETQYERAIRDNGGTYAEARNNYANLLKNELDRPEDAETQYERAIRDNDGTYADARYNYALLLKSELDRPEDAETQYERAIRDNDGTFAEARNNYANLLKSELDRPEDAETQYERAIRDKDGTFAEARNNYALLLEEELDQPEDAETQYERAIRDKDGTFAEARNNYALLLKNELDRLEDAETQYERAIQDNDGTYAEARYNYALLLTNELDRPEDAETQYERAIRDNDGTFAKARYNYALLLQEKLDQLEDAETQYERAIRDNDGPYPEAHFNLGTLLEALGRLDDARSHVEESISGWRDRNRLDNAIHDHTALVRICAKQDDYDAAIEYAADAIVLCTRTDDGRLSRFVGVIDAETDDVAPETLASEAYRAALRCVSNEKGTSAHQLFTVAFEQRDSVTDEPRRRARSAGVGLAALHDIVDPRLDYDPSERIEYDHPDALLADVADHASDLRPPVADCLTLLTGVAAEGTETDDVDGSLRRREESAFGRLTTLAM